MSQDPARQLAIAHEIALLAALMRDNPDLPDARRHWARKVRVLAAESRSLLAGQAGGTTPPGDDLAAILAWCRASCSGPALLREDGAARSGVAC